MVTVLNNSIFQGAGAGVVVSPNTTVPDEALNGLVAWDGSVLSEETGYVDESPAVIPEDYSVIPEELIGDLMDARDSPFQGNDYFNGNDMPLAHRIVLQGSRFLEDARAMIEETGILPHLMSGMAVVAVGHCEPLGGAAISLNYLIPGDRRVGLRPPRDDKQAVADRPSSQGFGLTTGFRLSQELRQALELSQSHRLELRLSQALTSPDAEYYGYLYDNARKLHVKIDELGLDFEVALVNRLDMPEMMHMGSAGMMAFGYPFVVEDFSVDLDDETRKQFIKLTAVHEYGEAIFGDHHMASLLELAVARHMGVLEPYIESLEQRYALKFRDVALHRLRGGLIDGLREAGFDIEDTAGEDAEEVWSPPERNAPEVVAARQVIEQYPVSDDVRVRFEAAVRDDMKMTDDELREWVGYITALEQTRAFHQRALQDIDAAMGGLEAKQDAQVADYRLALRLAIFRSLSVLAGELEDGILDDRIEPELKERMGREFLADARRKIEISPALNLKEGIRAELLSDPILDIGSEELAELARLDNKIWNGRGLKLFLVLPRSRREIRDAGKSIANIQEEQVRIEAVRREAWGRAMEAGEGTDAHSASFEAYAKVVEFYFSGSAQSTLENTLQFLQQSGRASGGEAQFLDLGDLQAFVTTTISGVIGGILHGFDGDISLVRRFMQADIDAALPAIWKARRRELHKKGSKPVATLDEPVGVELNDGISRSLGFPKVARLKYLNGAFDRTRGASRKALLRITAELIRLPSLSELYAAGLICEGLAVALTRQRIDHLHVREFLPNIGVFPDHLAMVEWDLEELFRSYRAFFRESLLNSVWLAKPEWILKAVKGNEEFWRMVGSFLQYWADPLIKLVQRYPDAVPQMTEALAGRTPETLWEGLDLQAAVRDDSLSGGGRVSATNSHLDFNRFLSKPYYFASYKDVPLLAAMARSEDWEGIGRWGKIHVMVFVDPADSKVQAGLYAEWIRETVVQELAERLHAPLQEMETKVPRFFVDKGEPDARTGYDRHGTLGTMRREVLVVLLEISDTKARRDAAAGALESHFEKVFQYYLSLDDLTAEEIGVELKAMASETNGLYQLAGIDVFKNFGLRIGIYQLYITRAIQSGRHFGTIQEVYDYLRSEGFSINGNEDLFSGKFGSPRLASALLSRTGP